MISIFDKEPLYRLIKDLYTVIGIRISIFDDGFNLVAEYPKASPAICSLIRTTEAGRTACRACDLAAFSRAKQMREPHVYKCHIGITEAITPITLGGGIIGYAIFAHMLPEDDYSKSINEICLAAAQYGLSDKDVFEAAKELKTHSNEKIMASIRLLDAIAAYLQIKKLAVWKNEDVSAQLKAFIDKNLDKDLSSDILCRHFYISRTKLYQISKKAFGLGISEFILERRIEKAKEILEKEDKSVADAANAAGIFDYNYFCKLFKKHTGMTPSQYKKSKMA